MQAVAGAGGFCVHTNAWCTAYTHTHVLCSALNVTVSLGILLK
jgi:hypothetical protein